VLLKDVFPLEPNEASQRLTALARHWPAMRVMKRYVKSKRWEILPLEAIGVSVGIDAATGADFLDIHDPRYFHPAEIEYDGPPEFFMRSVDTERARAADVERAELLGNDNKVMVESDYSPIAKFEQEEGLRTPPRLTPMAPTPTPKKKRRKAKQPSRVGRPHPTTAASPPHLPASQTAPDQQPENKAGPVLPTALRTSDPPKRVSAQEWVTAEAIRMIKAGEKIPPDARKHSSHFAKLLADRMKKAAETNKLIHPVKWEHIKNMLPKWKLWPIESIPSEYPDAFRDA
jgi:hypothetical protein